MFHYNQGNKVKEKKTTLLFRPQKNVVGLANGFQLGFEELVVLEPLLDLGLQFGTDGELPGDATRIPHGQHADGMTATGGAFRTALLVADRALEQGTSEDLRERR